MPLRFRRSLRIVPGVRLNLGRTGGSVSLGGAGHSVNLGRQGVRATVGLPGTGLSYTSGRRHRSLGGALAIVLLAVLALALLHG